MDCGHCDERRSAVTLINGKFAVCAPCEAEVNRMIRIYGAVRLGGQSFNANKLTYRDLE